MSSLPLTVHDQLFRSSRIALPTASPAASLTRDLTIYLLSGFLAAACVHFLDVSLKIPGHAILRSLIPVMIGLSLAPRHLGGCLIGMSALGSTALFRIAHVDPVGFGAMTSMTLIGPMLDMALWQARSGRSVIVRSAAAGIMTNLAAFAIRGSTKWGLIDTWTLRPVSQWWSLSPWSYILCGLVAGLIGGLYCFRWSNRHAERPQEPTA